MGHKSQSGLRHRGDVCERADGMTYEEVYDSEVIDGATFRRCRVCNACRTTFEDAYGRPVPEPVDECRIVEVDGETISVRGSRAMDAEDQEMFARVVRAAKAKYFAANPESVDLGSEA